MYLAISKIIPTKEWYHNPTLVNKDNETVAIRLADKGIVPPKEWHHDP